MSTFLWLLMVAGGPILLGLVVAFGIMKSRRLTPAERRESRRAVEEIYNEESQDRPPPPGGAV